MKYNKGKKGMDSGHYHWKPKPDELQYVFVCVWGALECLCVFVHVHMLLEKTSFYLFKFRDICIQVIWD